MTVNEITTGIARLNTNSEGYDQIGTKIIKRFADEIIVIKAGDGALTSHYITQA